MSKRLLILGTLVLLNQVPAQLYQLDGSNQPNFLKFNFNFTNEKLSNSQFANSDIRLFYQKKLF